MDYIAYAAQMLDRQRAVQRDRENELRRNHAASRTPARPTGRAGSIAGATARIAAMMNPSAPATTC